MKKFFIRLISYLIPIKHKRNKFLNKHKIFISKIKADLTQNKITVPIDRQIKIKIIGKGNTIKIASDIDIDSDITICIYGDNNTIEINSGKMIYNIQMGYSDGNRLTNNCLFSSGQNTHCNGAFFPFLEDNTSIKIGKDCMFSWNIEIRCTDEHSVLDMDNNVINKATSVEIGNHVWLGHDVTVMKNTSIPDNCVVGLKSIVTKKFTKPNCLIAGIPATIRKENINWDEKKPDFYEKDASK